MSLPQPDSMRRECVPGERRCVPEAIGWMLLLSLFCAPLPLGANRDYLWPLWVAAWSLMLAFVLARLLLLRGVPGLHHAPTCWALALMWIFTLGGFAYALGSVQEGVGPLPFPAAGHAADVPAALQANLRQCGYAMVLTLGVLYCDSARRLQGFAIVLFAAGVVQALIGVLVKFGDVHWPFLTAQQFGHPWATGTFVNRNHFAGFLELTGALGTGLLVGQLASHGSSSWRERFRAGLRILLGPRAWLRAALAATVVALVLSQSRAGNLAFFAAMMLAGLAALAWMRPLPRTLLLLLVSLLLVDLLVLGSWFGVERVVERVRETSLAVPGGIQPGSDADRIQVVGATLALSAAYPWLGTGPGSFRTVFPAVKPREVGQFYDHAHNDWAQLLLERGWIGLMAWMLPVLAALRAGVAGMRRSDARVRGIAFGSLMAISALLMHALADFNLQIPANAAYFHAVLALALASSSLAGRARRAAPPGNPQSAPSTAPAAYRRASCDMLS